MHYRWLTKNKFILKKIILTLTWCKMTLILHFITVWYNAIVTNSQTTKNVLYYIRSLQKVECKTEVRLCNMGLYITLDWAFGIRNIQVYYFSLRVLFLFSIIFHIPEGHKLSYHTTIGTKVTFYPDTKITSKKIVFAILFEL